MKYLSGLEYYSPFPAPFLIQRRIKLKKNKVEGLNLTGKTVFIRKDSTPFKALEITTKARK